MSYRPGDAFHLSFTTQGADGAATDADAAPAALVRRNGVADPAVAVAVAHNAAGDYTASGALPRTYSGGDDVELVISAAVAGIAATAVFSLGTLDRTAQTVAQVVYRTARAHFVASDGDASYDGLSPRTAKALPTQPALAAGDAILVSSGTFALGTSTLDLSGDGATGVHLFGAGAGATTIASDALLTGPGCIVKPGNGSQVSDLTIRGTAAVAGSADQYQAPLGASATQAPFTDAVARRLLLIADSDGLFISHPTAPVSLRAYECAARTNYDAVNLNAPAGRIELHDCDLRSTGPSTCNSGSVTRAVGVMNGFVEVHGGTLSAADADGLTRGVMTSGAGSATLFGVTLRTAAPTGSVLDLDNGGAGIVACDCDFAPTKTAGTITVQDAPATLAPTQSFNNTGQTTPLPASAGFNGPRAVTLVFRDAGGSPVPGVVFTIQNVGSATADGSGARTVALPAGTFTVRALPTLATLWPETTITVTVDATFTITGTAASIPAPASPSQTTGYLTTRDGQGNPLPNVSLTFQLVDPQSATDAYDQSAFVATSDAVAALRVPLLKGTKYQARLSNGPWVAFTTGADPTFPLPEVLGNCS